MEEARSHDGQGQAAMSLSDEFITRLILVGMIADASRECLF
jgi:hypothetical protein